MGTNNSFSSETANRYVLALYELAKENSELELVEKNVNDFLRIYHNSQDLENFIKNPTQSQTTQLDIFNKISNNMNLSKLVINFLTILVNKRRIFFIKKIFTNFLRLTSERRGEVKASLTSSKNLTSEELETLKQNLSETVGSSIVLDYNVDEDLIGGLKMQIGSLMIDTSIKNKLKKYEQILLEV